MSGAFPTLLHGRKPLFGLSSRLRAGTYREHAVAQVPKARLTVSEHISYQPLNIAGQDVSPPPFCQLLTTEEQVWRRIVVVTSEWTPVPLGWLDGQPVSMIILKNEEGQFFQVQPTQEERDAAAARIIEVGVEYDGKIHPFTIVRPHMNARFEPVGPIHIRCQTDHAKVNIIGVPG
jgi:hypothetical protein